MQNQIKTLTPTNINNWGAIGDQDNTKSFKFISRNSFYSCTPLPVEDVNRNKSPSAVPYEQHLQSIRRVDQLEKSLLFIKQQNANIVAALHSEVDLLKRQNQELQLKISFVQSIPSSKVTVNAITRNTLDTEDDKLRLTCLEREVNRLRKIVRDEQLKSSSLIDLLQQARFRRRSDITSIDEASWSESVFEPRPPSASRPLSSLQTTRSLQSKRLLDQRKFSFGKDQLEEENEADMSEAIIEQLQNLITKQAQENKLQATELLRIKEDLKDVLYTHKWTPETFLLTKSYVNSMELKAKQTNSKMASSSIPVLPEICSNQKVNSVKNPPYMHINAMPPNKQLNQKKT